MARRRRRGKAARAHDGTERRFSADIGTTGRWPFNGADYAEYRAAPAGVFFEGVSSYIYGGKYAIIHFEPDDVRVMVLHDSTFADAQRCWFDAVWEAAGVVGDE